MEEAEEKKPEGEGPQKKCTFYSDAILLTLTMYKTGQEPRNVGRLEKLEKGTSGILSSLRLVMQMVNYLKIQHSYFLVGC